MEPVKRRTPRPTLLGLDSSPPGDRLGGTGDTSKKESPSLYLCQFDLKEKRSFFGQRKDYWDFLCQGLARCRQEHEGIHFVTSLDKVGMDWWDTQGLVHTHGLLLACGSTCTCAQARTCLGTKHSPSGATTSFVPSGIPAAPQP